MNQTNLLKMSTEEFLRNHGGEAGIRVVKKGHSTLQRLWTEFPTVRDLVSSKPSQICYHYGDKVSSKWIIKFEDLLDKHGLYFGYFPPKK